MNCALLRRHVRATWPARRPVRKIALLQRRRTHRSLKNIVDVARMLRRAFPNFSVVEVESEAHDLHKLHRDIGDALVLIAPHGAALSNVFMLPDEAVVIEIGYTGTRQMRFPQSYYARWSASCGLAHFVALGAGEYTTRLSANLTNVRSVASQAIRQAVRF